MSFRLVDAVLKAKGLTTRQKLVLACFAVHADNTTLEAYPSQPTLAAMAAVNRSTVNLTLKDFVNKGLLKYVGKTDKGTNRYKVDLTLLTQLSQTTPVSVDRAPNCLAQLPPLAQTTTPVVSDNTNLSTNQSLNQSMNKSTTLAAAASAVPPAEDKTVSPTASKATPSPNPKLKTQSPDHEKLMHLLSHLLDEPEAHKSKKSIASMKLNAQKILGSYSYVDFEPALTWAVKESRQWSGKIAAASYPMAYVAKCAEAIVEGFNKPASVKLAEAKKPATKQQPVSERIKTAMNTFLKQGTEDHGE